MLASTPVASLLVIEDEALLGRQIARALAAAGHEVRVEASAAAGIAAFAASAPDLVLLDLRLPDRAASTCWSACAPSTPSRRWC